MNKDEKEEIIKEMRQVKEYLNEYLNEAHYKIIPVKEFLDKWIARLQVKPMFDDGDDGI